MRSALDCSRVTLTNMRAKGALITRKSRWIETLKRGREQPPGPASGRQRPQKRGVRPPPSVTPAKCVSCAAQNAALVVLLRSLQVVSVRDLRETVLPDIGSSTIAFV